MPWLLLPLLPSPLIACVALSWHPPSNKNSPPLRPANASLPPTSPLPATAAAAKQGATSTRRMLNPGGAWCRRVAMRSSAPAPFSPPEGNTCSPRTQNLKQYKPDNPPRWFCGGFVEHNHDTTTPRHYCDTATTLPRHYHDTKCVKEWSINQALQTRH